MGWISVKQGHAIIGWFSSDFNSCRWPRHTHVYSRWYSSSSVLWMNLRGETACKLRWLHSAQSADPIHKSQQCTAVEVPLNGCVPLQLVRPCSLEKPIKSSSRVHTVTFFHTHWRMSSEIPYSCWMWFLLTKRAPWDLIQTHRMAVLSTETECYLHNLTSVEYSINTQMKGSVGWYFPCTQMHAQKLVHSPLSSFHELHKCALLSLRCYYLHKCAPFFQTAIASTSAPASKDDCSV